MRKFYILIFSVLILAGCSVQTSEINTEVTTITNAGAAVLKPLVTEADPAKAIELIYEKVTIEGLKDADTRDLSRKFSIDSKLVDDYAVRYASGKYGIANVFILHPKNQEDGAKLRDQLEQAKLSISKECEHYDIYNSYQIAQDAQIFEQGGYVIMLMLPNNESARQIIDLYVPKN